MGDAGYMAIFVVWSAVVGAFFWWLLWRVAARPGAEALERRFLRILGVVIGVGLPAMALLGSVLFLTI